MLSKQYKLFSLNVDDALQIDEINKIRGKKIAIFMIVKFIGNYIPVGTKLNKFYNLSSKLYI